MSLLKLQDYRFESFYSHIMFLWSGTFKEVLNFKGTNWMDNSTYIRDIDFEKIAETW